MSLEELYKKVILSDGTIRSIKVNYEYFSNDEFNEANVEIILECRELKTIGEVSIKLIFSGNVYYDFFDDNLTLDSSGNYSDITFLKNEDKKYYLSLDPYDNSGIPNDEDNDIIKSDKLEIIILT